MRRKDAYFSHLDEKRREKRLDGSLTTRSTTNDTLNDTITERKEYHSDNQRSKSSDVSPKRIKSDFSVEGGNKLLQTILTFLFCATVLYYQTKNYLSNNSQYEDKGARRDG